MEQCFIYIEKRQSMIKSNSVHWHLMAIGCSLQPKWATGLLCTSVMLQQKDLSPSHRSEKLKVRPFLRATDACLSRTEHTLSLHQENMLPHEVISPAQAAWALCLLVRMCSRPKAYSYMPDLRCPSQHNFLIPFKPAWSWAFISILIDCYCTHLAYVYTHAVHNGKLRPYGHLMSHD